MASWAMTMFLVADAALTVLGGANTPAITQIAHSYR
jgi:hypothetical protein